MYILHKTEAARKLKRVISVTLSLVFLAFQTAHPLPEDIQVVAGDASVVVDGSTMTITAADNTILDYSSFDIGHNETLLVNLPNAESSILNRVIGTSASNIAGTLSSNGLFILINTNGIFVAPTANIDVQSLILSTRDISNQDFLNKEYLFSKISEEALDYIIKNSGSINIREGGFGVLIAGGIENESTIIAPVGKIALAAGDAIKLDISKGGLISVAILEEQAKEVLDHQGNPITDQIKNAGTIGSMGGTVILNAESITDVFSKAINLEGVVRATRVEEKDGTVTITSDKDIYVGGDIETSGNIDIYSKDGFIDLRNDINDPTLYSHYGAINLENHEAGINIYGTLIAPEGQVRLWTDGDLDLRGATCISKEGGYIYNPLDAIFVLWDGGAGTSSWDDALNWSGDAVPGGNNYNVTIDLASASVYTTAGVTIGDLAIGGTNTSTLTLDGALILEANLEQGTSGSLTVGTNGILDLNSFDLAVDGNFSNEGTIRLQGNETLFPFINDPDTGTVNYYGNGTYGTGLAAGNIYNDIIFSGGGTYTNTESLTVNGSMTILPTWAQAGSQDYAYRKAITIDKSKTGATLENFPILVSVTDENLKNTASGGYVTDDNGYDIIFTDMHGNQLSHEIEYYSGDDGMIVFWVKAEQLYNNTDTNFYMFYGNDAVTTTQEDINGTWIDSYVMVQHMNENAGIHYDSTSYGNNGDIGGSVVQGVSGAIDGADEFMTNGWITVGTNGLDTSKGSISAWLEWDPEEVSYGKDWMVASYYIDKHNRFFISCQTYTDRITGQYVGGAEWGNKRVILLGEDPLEADRLYHVVFNWDVGNQTYSLYVDGSVDDQGSTIGAEPLLLKDSMMIGAYDNSPENPALKFDGMIDEVRISNVVRSAEWIAAEFNNQSDPAAFHSFGSQVNKGAGKAVVNVPSGKKASEGKNPTREMVSSSTKIVDEDPEFIEHMRGQQYGMLKEEGLHPNIKFDENYINLGYLKSYDQFNAD
jgi:filamentous hemagglutinin family protein